MNIEQIQSVVDKHAPNSHYTGYTHIAKLVNSKRYLGRCVVYFAKKLVVIEISRSHAKNAKHEEVMDTVLHEIAHMLVGVKEEHNDNWKNACLSIGATPEAVAKCSDIAALGIEPKYVLIHKKDLRIISVAHSSRKSWVKRAHEFRVKNEPAGNLFCIEYGFYSKYITKKPQVINALIDTMEMQKFA